MFALTHQRYYARILCHSLSFPCIFSLVYGNLQSWPWGCLTVSWHCANFLTLQGVSATCLCLAATCSHVKALFFNVLRGPCLQVSRTMVRSLYFLLNTLNSSLGAVYFLMPWQWDAEWLWSTRCLFDSLWWSGWEGGKSFSYWCERRQIQKKHVWIVSMITTVILWWLVKNVYSLHEIQL